MIIDLLMTLILIVVYEPLCIVFWNMQLDTEIKTDEESKIVPLDILKWCLGLKV